MSRPPLAQKGRGFAAGDDQLLSVESLVTRIEALEELVITLHARLDILVEDMKGGANGVKPSDARGPEITSNDAVSPFVKRFHERPLDEDFDAPAGSEQSRIAVVDDWIAPPAPQKLMAGAKPVQRVSRGVAVVGDAKLRQGVVAGHVEREVEEVVVMSHDASVTSHPDEPQVTFGKTFLAPVVVQSKVPIVSPQKAQNSSLLQSSRSLRRGPGRNQTVPLAQGLVAAKRESFLERERRRDGGVPIGATAPSRVLDSGSGLPSDLSPQAVERHRTIASDAPVVSPISQSHSPASPDRGREVARAILASPPHPVIATTPNQRKSPPSSSVSFNTDDLDSVDVESD